MVKIKVCGLTDANNVKEVCLLSPDFIGFIFYKPSVRFVGDKIEEIQLLNLNTSIIKTGVFVNATLDEILDTAKRYALKAIQLHGDESADFCLKIKQQGYIVIKAFGLSDEFNFEQIKPYTNSVDFVLFDTKTESYGGSGNKFNWDILNKYQFNTPFWLSGGLSNDNLKFIESINHPSFYGVDLNSKFEISPGLKNIDYLKEGFKIINSNL